VCEVIAGKLAAGEALDEAERAHLAGCARCAGAAALVRDWRPRRVSGAVPDGATVRGLARRRGVRRGVLGAVATAAVVALLVGVLGGGGLGVRTGGAGGDVDAGAGAGRAVGAEGAAGAERVAGAEPDVDRALLAALDDLDEVLGPEAAGDLDDPFDDPVEGFDPLDLGGL
jgi:hypothetical protein